MRILLVIILSVGVLTPTGPSAYAEAGTLMITSDYLQGYKRTLFKHWIDSDKNGCDTRAEVLIEEAIVKPKIGPKCKLTGGKWLSAYDGKTVTNSSLLDVDHMVPLAEAWRSGAWKWTTAQRQAFANDLDNSEALLAVTLATNRSKGDRDPVNWTPKLNPCTYLQNWVQVKQKYQLTADSLEASFLRKQINNCGFEAPILISNQVPKPDSPILSLEQGEVLGQFWVKIFVPKYDIETNDKLRLQGRFTNFSDTGNCRFNEKYTGARWNDGIIEKTPITIYCRVDTNSVFTFYTFAVSSDLPGVNNSSSDKVEITIGTPYQSPSPSPAPIQTSNDLIVSPGAFCSPAGAVGKSTSGVSYTCKTSATDTRNRWRP